MLNCILMFLFRPFIIYIILHFSTYFQFILNKAQQSPRPFTLSHKTPLQLLPLPPQLILLFIQTITLLTQLIHTFQLFSDALPTFRLYLFVFPCQTSDFIVVLFHLLRNTYPIHYILYFHI